MAGVHEAVQHADQALDVGHVQSDRRFVEYVERVLLGFPGALVSPHLAQFGHQLEALRLAARQGRARLAEREVAETDVVEQRQRVGDRRMRGKESTGLGDRHRQHVGDGAILPAHGQRLAIEAVTAADIARDLDVGQEVHLDRDLALTFAHRAAPAAGVEREPAGLPAMGAGVEGVGEQLAYRIPEADVGGRAGTRGLADRCLVHLEHATDLLPALERAATADGRVAGQVTDQIGMEHVAGERGFAGSRDAGDDGQSPERHACIDLPEIVQGRTNHPQRGMCRSDLAARLHRMPKRLAQAAAGGRFLRCAQVRDRALGDH